MSSMREGYGVATKQAGRHQHRFYEKQKISEQTLFFILFFRSQNFENYEILKFDNFEISKNQVGQWVAFDGYTPMVAKFRCSGFPGPISKK